MYLKPQGWSCLSDPELPNPVIHDTFTCSHHNGIILVPHRCDPAQLGGFCKMCSGLICADCYNKVMKGGGCTVWEKRMDLAEKRQHLLASVESILNGEF